MSIRRFLIKTLCLGVFTVSLGLTAAAESLLVGAGESTENYQIYSSSEFAIPFLIPSASGPISNGVEAPRVPPPKPGSLGLLENIHPDE